jgi:acetylornithine deacetylase/succinyl-diaminopimelate desuccinylase-like protein
MTSADIVQLTSELVAIPSVTGPGAEHEVVAHLERLFAGLPGVVSEVAAGDPERPNVIATLDSGKPGPALLLTGHMDVVPALADQWSTPPFEATVVDGELQGRGTADMKGGLAALLVVFGEIARAGGPTRGRIVLAATSDEEHEGRWGLPWLVDNGRLDVDAAIVAEPAGVREDYDRLPVATRGSVFSLIRVTAPGGHASLGRSRGEHAVAVACALQGDLEQRFRPTPLQHWAYPDGATVVAGEQLRGGERLGELPRHAELSLSCRTLPGADEASYFAELDAFLAARVPAHCTVEVVRHEQIPAWSPGMELDRDHPLARSALAAVHAAGYPAAELGAFPAFSEGSFLAAAGVPTLPALGAGVLLRAHLPDERVSLEALRASVGIVRSVVRDVLAPGWEG